METWVRCGLNRIHDGFLAQDTRLRLYSACDLLGVGEMGVKMKMGARSWLRNQSSHSQRFRRGDAHSQRGRESNHCFTFQDLA